jgi:hypothetical protein
MCAQAGGTREGISISCLSFSLSPTNAHVFKIGTLGLHSRFTLVFQVAKRQHDSPFLGFCYGFNKAVRFVVLFCFVLFLMIIRGSFPEINSWQTNSFYLFYAY